MSENAKDFIAFVLTMALSICAIIVTIALCEKYLGLEM